MKTVHYLSFLLTIICLHAFGQSQQLQLTFTARDGGRYVQPDSIRVENPERGCDTMLYFPDTVLALDMIVGVDAAGQEPVNMILQQNFPNPFTGQTTFTLFTPEPQLFEITVSNLTGRVLAAGKFDLAEGWHAFRFNSGNPSVYSVNVKGSDANGCIRMISLSGSEKAGVSLDYAGSFSKSAGVVKSKPASGFICYMGDTLQYTCFAMTTSGFRGNGFMEDAPVQSQTYTFTINNGIPCPGIPFVVYEGQTYHTIFLGGHCWLRENLNVGVRLNADSNQTDNGIIEKYCYNNYLANCAIYGGLYQWDEMMQYGMTPGIQGICPPGWHIPSDDEWTALSLFLGGDDVAGGHLKEEGLAHWGTPNTGADNSYGFTALPAGMFFNGSFQHIRYCDELWSSTWSNGPYSWYRILYNNNAHFTRTNYFERWTSRSVRCVKN